MTAPERPAAGLDANARGILVLVVAVAVGLLLLLKGGDGAGAGESASTTTPTVGTTAPLGSDDTTTTAGDTTGTTGADGETTTTEGGDTGTARPAGEVKVIVLNGSGVTGAAKSRSEALASAGYVMGEPGNPAQNNDEATKVYFAEGYEADAVAVAAALGKEPTAAVAKPETTLGPGADDANVVVVLGKTDTTPT